MDQWRSKFSESFSLDRYWSINWHKVRFPDPGLKMFNPGLKYSISIENVDPGVSIHGALLVCRRERDQKNVHDRSLEIFNPEGRDQFFSIPGPSGLAPSAAWRAPPPHRQGWGGKCGLMEGSSSCKGGMAGTFQRAVGAWTNIWGQSRKIEFSEFCQRTPWGGGKKRGEENLTNDTTPKKGFWTPLVRYHPPSGVRALFFLYKNPRQRRPEALPRGPIEVIHNREVKIAARQF